VFKVYRYEGPKGEGPYMKDAYLEWNDLDYDYETSRPAIKDDFTAEELINIYPGSPWKFACTKKDELSTWFSEAVKKRLSPLGFAVKEIEAKEVIVSRSGLQCMYKKG
jgi:hypothetical protein